ncbi:uncharacterized protein LOC130804200 [Amaranthus tricolor]|uniref:uncharacterized protein LOC130804200 n=1 Tax=Amaranthus tricolor TaxID=29722 RepID=UPI00258A6818|nr:uncharacterized protein LOC130804200 [Amaranthus tricolor]
MSIVSLIMSMLLLLPMRACSSARHTFDLASYSKLQDAEKTNLVYDTVDHIKGFPMTNMGTKTSSEITSSATLDMSTSQVMKKQGLIGKQRSMLESESSHDKMAKKASDANEGEGVEDAVVMDYVAPHRKFPIHNQH